MKLNELHDIDEGWKSTAGAVAIAAAAAAGIAVSPKITIDGVTYDKAISAPPADAKIVTKDGKKYRVWQGTSLKRRPGGNRSNLYQPVDETREPTSARKDFKTIYRI
jgi:hypothetical protein